jgi:UDP-N-acetylglucosamine/UDP-N-acetylgalactosamine diphosphorylase
LRETFQAHGQGHVFAHWAALDGAGRQRLLEQTARLAPGLAGLLAAQQSAVAALSAPPPHDIQPSDAIALPEFGGDPARFEAASRMGQSLLEAGRVGVFVVAGGQGSRLGLDGPKGAFPVGPVTSRTLFEVQAQKIRGLARNSGKAIPWYVMTSNATDVATRALFEAESHFGLDPADVFIFEQDMVPACDHEGRLLVSEPGVIFENPNGHGGSLVALETSGALDDMAARGIDRIFYYQVDNPLVRMGDPVYLGFHEESGAEMSCKVIRKQDPGQKVGIVARVDGRPAIVEYTELSDEHRNARDADGQLEYWAGNIAIHVFNTDFVRRAAANADVLLPLHASAKAIPQVDDAGLALDIEASNGYKLERFVFDALPAAERVCVLEVRAHEEFSPIKNPDGTESPESARRAMVAQYRDWLAKAGLDVPSDIDLIEIDHARIDSAEEAAALGLTSLGDAGDFVRVATGMDQ